MMDRPTKQRVETPSAAAYFQGAYQRFRTHLAANVLQPLFWRCKGLPVGRRYEEFTRFQRSSHDDLLFRQNRMLRALLLHAIEHISGYRQMLSPGMSQDLERDAVATLTAFPILEKNDLVLNPDRFSKEIGRGTFRNSTGGSTGSPVTFLQDKVYQAANLAAINLIYNWADCPPGAPSIKLWGATRDFTGNESDFKSLLIRTVHNQLVLNCFILTDELMERYVRNINRFRPVIIEAYVDGVHELAKFIRNSGQRIDCRLRGVITSAGTLFPHMRALIEEVFGAPVFNRYGSREAGGIASECSEHQGLHIMGETTIIEIVDGKGAPAPAGEEGDILVTNLWNYSMPLIRYRIGDRGILSVENCTCGRPYPLLKEVTGRSSACLRRKDGVVSPAFFIHFIGVLHNDGSIGKFQVVQEAFDRVTVRLMPRGAFDLRSWKNREIIAEHLRKAMGESCQIEFKVELNIETTPTGKHQYTICKMPEASGSESDHDLGDPQKN